MKEKQSKIRNFINNNLGLVLCIMMLASVIGFTIFHIYSARSIIKIQSNTIDTLSSQLQEVKNQTVAYGYAKYERKLESSSLTTELYSIKWSWNTPPLSAEQKRRKVYKGISHRITAVVVANSRQYKELVEDIRTNFPYIPPEKILNLDKCNEDWPYISINNDVFDKWLKSKGQYKDDKSMHDIMCKLPLHERKMFYNLYFSYILPVYSNGNIEILDHQYLYENEKTNEYFHIR